MPAINRAAVLTKLHKVLKKHYEPVNPPAGRTLLENMLFACCLENSPYAAAEQAYEAVSKAYFDWNEVRVSTVKEISEVMKALPDPQASANLLRRCLQATFEANYSFDLEPMKKLNLGVAVQKLSSYDGMSPFVVSYITQTSLGGHSIPLDAGAMGSLAVLGLVEEGASAKDGCSGMERAIPKNKGLEFGSLLHQLSVDYTTNPYSTNLHKILLEVDSEAKARLPKRGVKPPEKPAEKPSEKKAAAAAPAAPAKGAKPDAKGKATEDDKKKPAAAPAPGKKPAAAPAPAAKKPAPAPAKKALEKKPAAKSAPPGKRKPR
jgi:endonuclease-3